MRGCDSRRRQLWTHQRMDTESLIGRDEERAVLDRAIAAARAGQGSLLLVTGEAGVGKTALVAAALAESDLLPLVGSPTFSGSEPYGPIAAVFRAFLRATSGGPGRSGPR